MALDHCLHCLVQAVRIEPTVQRDAHLHRVDVVARTVGHIGVKQQPLLQCSQRQNIGDLMCLAEFVDLLLSQPGGCDIRRRQTAAAAVHMCTDARESIEPQAAEPAHLCVVQS